MLEPVDVIVALFSYFTFSINLSSIYWLKSSNSSSTGVHSSKTPVCDFVNVTNAHLSAIRFRTLSFINFTAGTRHIYFFIWEGGLSQKVFRMFSNSFSFHQVLQYAPHVDVQIVVKSSWHCQILKGITLLEDVRKEDSGEGGGRCMRVESPCVWFI